LIRCSLFGYGKEVSERDYSNWRNPDVCVC
jgi:hypothetical protein